MQLSYWEHKTWLNNIDLLIIGSGIVGLNAAIQFKTNHPKAKVLVVERGILPHGASTKNAGFACFGSLSELVADLKNHSINDVISLIHSRFDGLELLRKMHGDEILSYRNCGGYEMFTPEQHATFQNCMQLLPEMNKKLKDLTGFDDTYLINRQKISDFGFKGVEQMIFNRAEGAIDTGKMMQNLLKIAVQKDVLLLNNIRVDSILEMGNGVEVQANDNLNIPASKVLVATNGFAARLLKMEDVKPGRTQVFVTAPIDNLKIDGCFHFNEGYVYFRNIDNRILLGGGRHLDIEGETTDVLATTERIQNYLNTLLSEVIIPHQNVQIDYRWAGILGLGATKKPILKSVSNNVFCAVRLGGMGVAIGSKLGKDAADLITSS